MQRAVIHGVPSTVCRLAFSQKLKSPSTWRRLTCRLAGDQQLRWYSSGGQPVAGNSYVDEMYKAWQRDPKSVHMTWDDFFRKSSGVPNASAALQPVPRSGSLPFSPAESVAIDNHNYVSKIIRAYQVHGHLLANVDPLGITGHVSTLKQSRQSSDRSRYEVVKTYLDDIQGDNKLDMVFELPPSTFIGGGEKALPLKEIIRRLENVYCSSIGVECHHLTNPDLIAWIRKRMEVPGAAEVDKETRHRTLKRLLRATGFEAFLAKKWSSEKRFGLEGCEALIPAMKQIIDRSTTHGVESFVMGMPHRGRLNVLANVCRKPLEQLFIQFAGLEPEDSGSGDVKYHLGTYVERLNRATNKNTRVAVVANPSHLEAVDPVVQGKTKAEQFYRGDTEGRTVMSILVHGDAAFAGQGVVFETFHLSALPAYSTHGTVHIVANNQIGFTTDPRFSRSSPYCTDVGKVVNAPIFHVNADDPDAVIHVCNIAADFRALFHRDVVVDLICYRRSGHNEIDEPMFTQPLMYQRIKKLKPVLDKYSAKLIEEGVMSEAEVKERKVAYDQICEKAYKDAQDITHVKFRDWLDSPWKGFFKGERRVSPTGIDEETLVQIGKKFSSPPPEDFEIHRGLQRILSARMDMINSRTIDWALAEALAFGSLMKEGVHVRLSGQDVERGTFSHRHHVLHHQSKDGVTYTALSHLYPDQASYTVCNSSLSEYAVLGFELGYSMTNPNSLVMWEAQFGDFNNTAQCIIDQFICSGESKWVRQSGLVMLLPHGMEGMGPEHSSSRLERFLQMSDDDPDLPPEQLDEGTMLKQLEKTNWIVANCTTPANIFHILRRQIALPFRKPLVVMSPKSLLRLPDARSSFDELLPSCSFRPVLGEEGNFRKLLICSGRVYYDLKHARQERELQGEVGLIRVEQLTPFPYYELQQELSKNPDAKVAWVQEEHKNQGSWSYVRPRLRHVCGDRTATYTGRPAAASPATGSKHTHTKEGKRLLDEAFK